jgi:hypothetical protein
MEKGLQKNEKLSQIEPKENGGGSGKNLQEKKDDEKDPEELPGEMGGGVDDEPIDYLEDLI